MNNIFIGKKMSLVLLQAAFAFAFLYAAFSSFIRPNDWVGYLPGFLKTHLPGATLLKIFSSFEVILAFWLLSGWKLFYAALVAAIVFAAITLANLTIFDVTFRDVSLFLAALSLATLAKSGNSK